MLDMARPSVLYGEGNVSASRLSSGASSLLRWLSRWYSQTEEALFPSTAYIARKQKRSERTVYRWLAELRSSGCVQTETVPGVERRIVPQVAPADCPKPTRRLFRCKKMSGVLSGVLSGVSPYPRDAYTENDNKGPEGEPACPDRSGLLGHQVSAAPMEPELTGLVRDLASVGVSVSTAQSLIHSFGEDLCRLQLVALACRKAVDRSAVLVASIRGGWAVPEQVVKGAKQAQKLAVRASETQEREKRRQEQQERFSALPGSVRDSLEARARSLWHQEQPQAARIMEGRPGALSVIRSYALRLMEGGSHESV